MQFGWRGEHVDFELCLIEELAVAVCVLNDTEWFFLIHFVFFDLLYLEFFIFMQDVLFELILILLQDLDVRHSVVEMGGNEFLEVTHVHELWVDAFKHFLVEVELQHVFVFFSVTDESWVKEFKWSCPG